MSQAELIQTFCSNAQNAAAKIFKPNSTQEIVDYVLNLISNTSTNTSTETCNSPASPNLALAGLADHAPQLYQLLAKTAKAKNIICLDSGLRAHLTGISLALTPAQAGVAASGSCLVASGNDDVRLATMISEVSLLLLNPKTIMAQLPDLAPLLRQYQQQANYTALITGPSRTADIERVLAIGVHGPLELHIILWDQA